MVHAPKKTMAYPETHYRRARPAEGITTDTVPLLQIDGASLGSGLLSLTTTGTGTAESQGDAAWGNMQHVRLCGAYLLSPSARAVLLNLHHHER